MTTELWAVDVLVSMRWRSSSWGDGCRGGERKGVGGGGDMKVIGPRSSLRRGEGELGNLKLKPMAPTKLHNIKQKHAI